MKITKTQLENLIKEELQKLNEGTGTKVIHDSVIVKIPTKIEIIIEEDNRIEIRYPERENMKEIIKKQILKVVQKATGNKNITRVGGNLLLDFPTYISTPRD